MNRIQYNIKKHTNCVFCKEQKDRKSNPLLKSGIQSRVCFENNYWFCVPTLGCLREGYFLLISKRHFLSTSKMSKKYIVSLLKIIKQIERHIVNKYAMRCIWFEHGVNDVTLSGPSSIDHAHLHILPMEDVVWNSICSWFSINCYMVFDDYYTLYQYLWKIRPRSYMVFCDSDSKIYLINDASKYPSQFFRMVVAKILNREYEWNWKYYPFISNMIRTLHTVLD